VPNSFEKNVCKNTNTLAHVVEHLVVLAPLRRRWSLSGRKGLGSSLPPAELARRDLGVFDELKRLFSFMPMSSFGGDVTWCFHELKHVL
jgi:hypothetical protein